MHAAIPDFRLDDWVVRTQRCCLERGSETRRVKPKAMQVLECLASARGAVVTRNELFDTIWPGHTVTDDVLTNCVVELRKAFDDSPRDSRVIETIPKKGFRLVGEVRPVGSGPAVDTGAGLSWRSAGIALTMVAGILMVVLGSTTIEPVSPASADLPKSVAVLAFVDLSPDRDQEYFADGLSEELINRLTRIQGLQVTGRTSSFHFKGRNEDLRNIGQQLSVSYVLEGSVRKSDDTVRVSVQLVDVNSGFHLWSDSYDREFEEIFAIQQDISESVARALSIRLKVGEIGNLNGGTDNVDAFDAAMLGNAAHHELTAESTLAAIDYFEEATRLDPDFALAWERLANTYRTAWLALGNDQSAYWAGLADEAIARALAGAPDSEDVLHTAAYIEVDRQNWAAARRLFDQAMALDPPGHPKESGAYLDLLAKTGSISEALRSKEHLSLVDPLHPDLAMYLGHLYLASGRVDDALAELERGYGLGGYQAQISVEGTVAALASGDEGRIMTWLRRAVENQQPGARGVHDAMLERFGDRDAALAWLWNGFESESAPDYYAIVWGSYYGDDELVLAAMRRSPDLWAFWTPLTQPLRGTEAFREILESTGLVDYWRQYGWNDFCRPQGESGFVCS